MDLNHQKEVFDASERNKQEIENKRAVLAEMKEELNGIYEFKKVRLQIQEEVQNLRDLLNNERQRHEVVLNEIENDKVQRMEKMRKDMLLRVKEVKTAMLNLTEDKLQGTTRLTIKQNKQLTSELEYQSKQTEHLMFQNFQMQNEIKNLIKDKQIHEEVEKELAKRSHFCQKVIEKYKEQIADLKAQIKDIQEDKFSRFNKNNQGLNDLNSNDNQDLMNFLEKRISDIDGKLRLAQVDQESLQDEYQFMQEKLEKEKKKYEKLAMILTEYLDEVLSENEGLIQENQDIHLDVESIKEYDKIEDVPAKDRVALLLVLLKQLQPLLTDLPKNIMQSSRNKDLSQATIDLPINRSMTLINKPIISTQQKLNLKSQLNRYSNIKGSQSSVSPFNNFNSKSPYSNNNIYNDSTQLDHDTSRNYSNNTHLKSKLLDRSAQNIHDSSFTDQKKIKLFARNQRVFQTQNNQKPTSINNQKYVLNNQLSSGAYTTSASVQQIHSQSLIQLKKGNQPSDSILQAYSNYGMRNKLKDIENKINSAEVSQFSSIKKQKQIDGNKSSLELGSHSLGNLPKLNNSFM
ncbi:UNKNOWN [Stylonychia lemnae]|uniref:Cilia- and flagella-associated protein 157 n=1 Tax=Stylonychia lemnae TaxID=5949 RepID=A0A077ZZC8_STYLE|nr:UNKNOWN [Stylonychia lemnae]|eukprot:CDW75280.1 UNKNOWN [Stylonychia lemnae]